MNISAPGAPGAPDESDAAGPPAHNNGTPPPEDALFSGPCYEWTPAIDPDLFEDMELVCRTRMSTVYRTEFKETGEVVALKVLHIPPHHPDREEEGRRFLQEYRVLGLLYELDMARAEQEGRSGGFVRPVACSAGDAPLLWIAMEWIAGKTLEMRLADGSVNAAAAAPVMAAVCRSISVMHGINLYHRDIKLANVMFRTDNPRDTSAVLLDFGIVRDESSTGERHTRAGRMFYSLENITPEQAAALLNEEQLGLPDSQTALRARDVWALGAMLYTLLTGSHPYAPLPADGIKNDAFLWRLAWSKFTPPGETSDATRSRLMEVCRRALVPDPARRYSTALDMEGAIKGTGDIRRVRWYESLVYVYRRDRKAWNFRIAAAAVMIVAITVFGFFAAAKREKHARWQQILDEATAASRPRQADKTGSMLSLTRVLLSSGQADLESSARLHLSQLVSSMPVVVSRFTVDDKPPGGSPVFLPGGKKAAFRDNQGRVEIRDAVTGARSGEPLETTPGLGLLVFSEDGSRAATAEELADPEKGVEWQHTNSGGPADVKIGSSALRVVRFWDLATGTPVEGGRFEMDSRVRCAAFRADGSLLTGCDDGSVFVLTPGGKRDDNQISFGGSVQALTMLPDGKRFAAAAARSGDAPNRIVIYNIEAGSDEKRVVVQDLPSFLQTDAAGALLIGASSKLMRWNPGSAAEPEVLYETRAGSPVFAWAAAPDGRIFMGASGVIRVFDPARDGVEAWEELPALFEGIVDTLTITPDGRLLTAGNNVKSAAVCVRQLPRSASLLKNSRHAQSIHFSPDSRSLTAGAESAVRAWDAASGALIASAPPATPAPEAAGFAGDWLVSGASHLPARAWNMKDQSLYPHPFGKLDATIKRFNVATGTFTNQDAMKDTFVSFAFDQAGGFLAGATDDARIMRWVWSTGEQTAMTAVEIPYLEMPARPGYGKVSIPLKPSVALLRDARHAIRSVGSRTELIDFSATPAVTIRSFAPDARWGAKWRRLALSPDEKALAIAADAGDSAGTGAIVTVWNVADGTQYGVDTFVPSVTTIALGPDRRTVFYGNAAGAVRLLDSLSGAAGTPLTGLPHEIRAMAASPDGAYIAASSWQDGIIIIPAVPVSPSGLNYLTAAKADIQAEVERNTGRPVPP